MDLHSRSSPARHERDSNLRLLLQLLVTCTRVINILQDLGAKNFRGPIRPPGTQKVNVRPNHRLSYGQIQFADEFLLVCGIFQTLYVYMASGLMHPSLTEPDN